MRCARWAAAYLCCTVALAAGEPTMRVEATWYGRALHGRVCAMGLHTGTRERFDAWGQTFACNFLPLGTWVRFRNPHNQRVTLARCTDRIRHPRSKYHVDVSEGVAIQLDIKECGVATLEAAVVRWPEVQDYEAH